MTDHPTIPSTSKGIVWLAVVLAAAGLVLLVVRWVAAVEIPQPSHQLAYDVLMSVVSLMAASLCLLVARFGATTPGGHIMALFLAFFSVASAYEGSANFLAARYLPLTRVSVESWRLLFGVAVCGSLAAGTHWLQLFPRRLAASDVDHAIEAPPLFASRGATRALERFRRPLSLLLGRGRAWLIFGLLLLVLSSLERVGVPLDPTVTRTVGGLVAAWFTWLTLVVHRRTAQEDRQRAQARWITEAVVLGGLTMVLALAFEFQVHVLDNRSQLMLWLHACVLPTGFLVFLLSLAISVFRRGALTSSLLLRRATISGIAGVCASLVFVVSEELVSSALSSVFGFSSNWGGVVAGVLAAAAFARLRGLWPRMSAEAAED